MRNTRRTLERVPFEKADWRPHGKSPTLGGLAVHLAMLPRLAVPVLTATELDITTAGSKDAAPDSTTALLQRFDACTAAARTALLGLDDDDIRTPWTLRVGERELWTMPRLAAYRAFVMNHLVHHRAQIGVYLRLNDVAVPAIYGPSADEAV